MNLATAFPVTDPSQVAEPRRAVQWLASHLDFDDERAGRAVLIVTELGTNLAKHARGGELLVQAMTSADGSTTGIEILSLDTGPGLPDLARSRRDGYSTTGTLGHGLGALDRLADSVDLFTQSTGTAIAARICRDRPRAGSASPRFDVGAVNVAKPGEQVSGDAWAWRKRQGRLSLFIADGLGHGLAANDAATAAVRTFAAVHESPPVRIIADVDGALRSTRGAAVAVAAVDIEAGVLHFAGLGNIAGAVLLPGGGRRQFVSHNGTAGHIMGRVQEFHYPVPDGSMVVMFSDGLGTSWDLSSYPGLVAKSASIIAGVLYRDFSRRRDDVTVVVVRQRPALAEKE
jgi:anti-sigma regulatory factor (Ser/Thr protein kinase)